MTIDNLFYPRAVAVVGSTAQGKIAYELLKQLVEGGFPCTVAVNPKAQGVFGVPAYASLREVREPVDLVIVASPAPTVAGVLEESGLAGAGAAVIITSGFSEVGNHAGEEELKAIARRHGIRLVGPNCAGMLNTANNLFPTLETRPPRGPVAFISQSGALGGAVLSWAEEQGVGFSKFVSFGNRSDLDEVSLLPYLADDPDTQLVALYIESVSDGRAFMAAVRDFTRRKPLIVIKSGRSQAGQRATLSHTGSLAGADAVYHAALRACGAIRVASIEEMFDLCRGFVTLPRVRGRRVVIVTNSGGPGVLAADRAEGLGLTVAEPSAAAREQLRSFLPAHCAFKNPIDLTVEGTEKGYQETLSAVLPEYDAALALNVAPPYLDSMPLARGVLAAAKASGKPIVANFMAGRTVANAVHFLEQHGLPNFATGERAMTVLARMASYQPEELAARQAPEIPAPVGILPGHGRLLEPEAMVWLRQNGLPAPDLCHAMDAEAAVAGSRELGYPVVMKVVSPDILHKSESGGVRLNIGDDSAAQQAFEQLRRVADAQHATFDGVVIYRMMRGAQEALVGLSRDPQFGPVIVFGLGGIYAEIWHDIALRVAPIDAGEAAAMVREIRGFPILQGARGQAPCDLDALYKLLVKVGELPFRYPEIGELDLNPVFLLPSGAVIGDVRIIKQAQPEKVGAS